MDCQLFTSQPTLSRKIDFAVKLLRSIPQDGPVEICYSGGKDSDVILELAKMAGIPFRAIYKATTIDPPGTIRHCRENGVTVMQPRMTFFQLVEKSGCPTRRARFCCEKLKEYKVLDRAVQGIRRTESKAREKRYKEPEICRVYSAKEKVRIYLPILTWTDDDVERFIEERGVRCHPLYYDESGRFHVERRLGCIGCPLQSDRGVADYLKYPGMLKALVRAAERFLESHPDSCSKEKFGDACHLVIHNLFFDSYEDYKLVFSEGLFGPEQIPDAKKFLEDYFKIELILRPQH